MILLAASLIFLPRCAQDEGNFESERDALLSRFDSLASMTDARIANLQASGQATTAMDENAIRQEIAELRQLKTRLTTEKDNLQVAQPSNWRHMRDSLEKNIMTIKESYFAGQE